MYEKRSVDEWLNLVDYEFAGYIPSKYALMFVNFIKEVNGGSEENETPLFHLVMMDRVFNEEPRCAIMVFRGAGKCLDIYSEIATPNGYKLLRDIEVGDIIYDRNLQETRVTQCSPIYTDKECYKITLDDNSSFICSNDHQHFVQRRTVRKDENGARENVFLEEVLTTDDLLEKGYYYTRKVSNRTPSGKETKYYIPIVNKPINYEEQKVYIEPYTFGCLLGDGTFSSATLIGLEEDIQEIAREIPYKATHIRRRKRNPNVLNYYFSGLKDICKKYDDKYKFVKDRKFIPEEYIYNTVDVRLAILQGLMDTDGTIDRNGFVSFTNMSLSLCEGLLEIVKSLGGKGKIIPKKTIYNIYYNVYFNLPEPFIPFRLKRKLDRYINNQKDFRRLVGIKDIEKVDNIEVKCITVDSPTESYVFNGNYITHNSTIFGEYLILFIASFGYLPGFGKVDVMMYVSDSIENGVKNLRRNIEIRYDNSDFLKKLIPDRKIGIGTNDRGYVSLDEYENEKAGRKFTDIRMEFINNRGNHLVVRGFGASTGVRGVKELGVRPQVAILDDMLSDEDAKSPTIIENIENTVYKAVSKALHPKRQKIIWLGTPFNANDPLYKAVESGAWKVSVFPICEKFPISKEEFKGAWEDRFSYDHIKREYTEAVLVGRPDNFNQELMLRINSNEDRLVENNDIIKFKKEDVLKKRYNYNFYITTDFATSEKKSADYSVISVWAISNNNDYMLIDGFCKQCDTAEFIDNIFRLAGIYQPLGVGIEISGQQKAIVSWLRSEQIKRNIFFNFLSSNNDGNDGIRPIGDKFSRFMLFVPRIKQKKLWISEEMLKTSWGDEFKDEIEKASKKGFKSRHDDVLDSISMLGSFECISPSAQSNSQNDEYLEDGYNDIKNTIF